MFSNHTYIWLAHMSVGHKIVLYMCRLSHLSIGYFVIVYGQCLSIAILQMDFSCRFCKSSHIFICIVLYVGTNELTFIQASQMFWLELCKQCGQLLFVFSDQWHDLSPYLPFILTELVYILTICVLWKSLCCSYIGCALNFTQPYKIPVTACIAASTYLSNFLQCYCLCSLYSIIWINHHTFLQKV